MAARNLTRGSVPRLLVQLALPVWGSFVLQSAYHLADLFFVGLLGSDELAALAIAVNTFFVTLALAMMVGAGALALLSQAYGAGNFEAVPRIFHQALWLSVIAGVGLGVACFWGAQPFYETFSPDSQVQSHGVAFFRVYAIVLCLQVIGVAISMTFRALGDFVTPTVLASIGVGINLGLDPLLIFGFGPVPALGFVGAAWASVAAQGIALAVALWLLQRPGMALSIRPPWTFSPRVMLRILRIGIPSGLTFFLFAVTMFVTYRYLRPFGPEAAAAAGIGFRILEAASFPAISLATAVSSLVGQNYGARRMSRVRSTILWGMVFGTGIAVVEVIALLAAPAFWIALFTRDAEVIVIGAQYLAILSVVLLVTGPTLPGEFAGMGLGRTVLPFMAQVVRMGALLGLLVLLVDRWGHGLSGVFWSRSLSIVAECTFLAGVVVFWWFTVLRDRPEPTPTASLATEGATSD